MKQKKDHIEKPESLNDDLTSPVEDSLIEDQESESRDEDIQSENEVESILEDLSLEDKVLILKESYKEIEAKAEEYLDGWQRSRAEFANYKKRVLKEYSDIHQSARGEVIKIYLDISDDRLIPGL